MGHGGIFGRSSLGTSDSCDAVREGVFKFCLDKKGGGVDCFAAVAEAVNSGCMTPAEGEQYKLKVGTGTKTGVTKSEGTPNEGTPTVSDYSGQACNSKPVIEMVQGMIGTTPDGNWGPASQTALEKNGGNFKALAPNCTGNPPSYGAITGGGGGGTVTTTTAIPPTYGQPAQASMFSGLLSKPIVWVGIAMMAVGGYALFTGKKGKKVKRNAASKSLYERAVRGFVKAYDDGEWSERIETARFSYRLSEKQISDAMEEAYKRTRKPAPWDVKRNAKRRKKMKIVKISRAGTRKSK